jgi:hypothetical protein
MGVPPSGVAGQRCNVPDSYRREGGIFIFFGNMSAAVNVEAEGVTQRLALGTTRNIDALVAHE